MKYIFTLFLSLGLLIVNAQESISKSYFNKKNMQVEVADSAYYIREINTRDASGLYKIKENYINGSLKLEGFLLGFNPSLTFEGLKKSYYENGNIELEENFSKGQKVGDSKSFYQNGNLKEHVIFFDKVVRRPGVDVLLYRTVQVADSLGKTFLDEKGSGLVDLIKPNISEETGEYVNGFKNGLWITTNLIKNEKYEDVYQNGKYIEGKTLRADGTVITYNVLDKLPEFVGGVSAFGKFLGQNLKYPPTARQNKTQGRVFVGFVVQSDGSVSDIKVLRGVSRDLDEAAKKVIAKSPKWIPGVQRGVAVKVAYTVPISFQLGN